ncbi:Uncharacterised protein [Mycobacteroides abscessus subsp. abscessus]|nr:Uncharacterised protein [Mycobacteroides abscessus subsp. abscessus]
MRFLAILSSTRPMPVCSTVSRAMYSRFSGTVATALITSM